MSTTRISDSDLASVALYDKVNQMVEEIDEEKQLISNLEQTLSESTTKYPSSKAVKEAIDAKDSLPEQDGKDGKALFTDGENAYWGDVSGVTIRDWSV